MWYEVGYKTSEITCTRCLSINDDC